MVAQGDGYSRLVAWLKIVLPMLALAILSTLFLVSRTIDPSQTIPYADVDVEGLARDQRIGAPSYAGMTEDGAAISFDAASARPEPGGRVIAEAPVARIELPTGRSIVIRAAQGYVDQNAGIAALDGAAVVETSDGYRIETDHAQARLDSTAMESAGPVTGEGPPGKFEAGRMVLVQEAPGTYVLRFERGIKLIYRPGT